MPEMTRISVPVTIEERDALVAVAQQYLRHPRDQARHLLRAALGLTGDESKQKPVCNPEPQTHTRNAQLLQSLDLALWEADYHFSVATSALVQAEQHLALAEAAQLRRRELERAMPAGGCE